MNIVVGLYIEQVCLACLFFLKASGSTGAAVAQAAFMLVLLGITALAQLFINHSYSRKSRSGHFDCMFMLICYSPYQISAYVIGNSKNG